MKTILIIPLFCLIFSCSKSKDSQANSSNLEILRSAMWVADSVQSMYNNITTTTYVVAPTYLKIEYKANGTYTVYTSYDSDNTKNYEVSGKYIYYWQLGQQKDPNSYSEIISLSKSKFINQQVNQGGEITRYFFHAE